MTSGTFGPSGTGSSRSAALQTSLESRLRARMSSLGSILFSLTWKPLVTPAGRSLFRLRASARRTCATERSSWPTPTSRDHKDGAECANVSLNSLLGRVAWLAHWPTTTTTDAVRKPSPDFETPNITLNHAAVLASWPTPTSALEEKGVRSTEGGIREAMRSHGPDLAAMACLASWPTPTSSMVTMGDVVQAMSSSSARPPYQDANTAFLMPARLTASGQLLTGSSAEMANGGQLSPAHSRWLMGCPSAWESSIPGFTDWQKWQVFLRQASSVPNPIAQEA